MRIKQTEIVPEFDLETKEWKDVIKEVEVEVPDELIIQDERNRLIVEEIRKRYSVNDEFALINKFLQNPQSGEYVAYRVYVEECKARVDSILNG